MDDADARKASRTATRLRGCVALSLLACIGVAGSVVGCLDDTQATGPESAASVRRVSTVPTTTQTMSPPPPDMPGGGRGYSDFTKGQKGKP